MQNDVKIVEYADLIINNHLLMPELKASYNGTTYKIKGTEPYYQVTLRVPAVPKG